MLEAKLNRYVKELILHEEACIYADFCLDNLSVIEIENYSLIGVTDIIELYTLVWDKAYRAYFYNADSAEYNLVC
jgi:hypothetical protein